MGCVLWDWIRFIVRVKVLEIKPANDVIWWGIPNRIYGGGWSLVLDLKQLIKSWVRWSAEGYSVSR